MSHTCTMNIREHMIPFLFPWRVPLATSAQTYGKPNIHRQQQQQRTGRKKNTAQLHCLLANRKAICLILSARCHSSVEQSLQIFVHSFFLSIRLLHCCSGATIINSIIIAFVAAIMLYIYLVCTRMIYRRS